MHWTEIVRRRHAEAQNLLAQATQNHAISVPIGDSDWTAPGYLLLGYFYSCVPDVAYPFDPAVLRAIRVLCPDAMPITIRSVWQWSNYHELGRLGDPVVLVRHGIARAIRVDDRVSSMHDFRCEMPAWPVPGLRIPGRSISDCRPNYIEVSWEDRGVRSLGQDQPGAYLPFDWELYYSLRQSDIDNRAALAQSRREVDEDGSIVAKGAADSAIQNRKMEIAGRKQNRADEDAYIRRDIDNYYCVEPTELELKERLLGDTV